MVNTSVLFSYNRYNFNKIETIEDLCDSTDYTIIYSLSISDCLGCYNSRILSINEFFLKKKETVKIIYLYQENLNKDELNFLSNKYKDGLVSCRNDNNISDFLLLNSSELFILLDRNGKEIFREKLHLIKNIDDSMLKSQVLNISSPIKLKSKDNILFAPSIIQINKTALIVLDKIQNKINSYNPINGESLYSISIPIEIENYFKNIDSTQSWKWNYVPPLDIQNFCLKKDTLIVFYRAYTVDVDFKTNAKTNNIDTNLTFYPNILIAKYFQNELTSIKHFQNDFYIFDFEGIRFTDDNYIVNGYEKIENNFPFVENPDSLSILLLTNSNFENIQSIVKKEDIQNRIGKKYYSFFGINNFLIDGNNIFAFNLLNSTLFLVENIKENKKSQITSVKPYGIIMKNFDLINSQEIKPWDFLKNPDKFNLPSNTLDIGQSNQNYFIFSFNKSSKKDIQNIQAINYNKNGLYNRTYQISYDEIKDYIYDFKYAGYDENKLFVLIKWKEKGWCLHDIHIN
jgi:hypothetical protein